MRRIFFVMLAGMLIFSGCKTTETQTDVSVSIPLSGQFSMSAENKPSPGELPDDFPRKSIDKRQDTDTVLNPEPWWQFLGSDDLDHLIEQALVLNFDLKTLDARLAQARATISKTDAAFFPLLDFSFGGQKKHTRIKTSSGSSPRTDGSHSWDGSLSGSYSPDVWGEYDADKKAALMSHDAAAQDLSAFRFELTVNIVQTWVDIIAARHKKQILHEQIKTNDTVLKLLKLRFRNGKATALDISQQQEAIAEVNAQLPLLEKQEQVLIHALALLSGKTTADGIQLKTVAFDQFSPLPDIGIPSDLLKNRSDIQAARMRLLSATWDIKAAKADLLPSFSLTARALFSSGKLDLLFQNWVATLAASIAGPLFDGGQRHAEIERVKAVVQEKVNLYAAVVARAVFEVEDSLISIQKQDQYVRLLEQELAIARVALRDALVQYQNGKSSYLNYLTAQAGVQRLERQLAGEQSSCVKERIGLYKSLGGKGASGIHPSGNRPVASDGGVE
ncbi:MAG: efflux transporter outer membrane subunit [Proteobacteria bacterium]|nr:efflux transporter outer membrane subunit [Pseudomonadota bacterium]MBU1387427.1 efflux transporter outer membrane subunit [Pseudomonadota bacterium]MBU1541712.1 efflux transporter outer membrane subunit [Pseudomonadota bacterium]MBU2431334.1 efflux transporter outer membrane subunit [Pseudomonadota bacterium]MBU2481985.1 efflux transporter outer membrane subunit [Pseudomonadota bacterium]